MKCRHCGGKLETGSQSLWLICASRTCQLVHDLEGVPKGWAMGAGPNFVPGGILPYDDVVALWKKTGVADVEGLKAMHVAAIINMLVLLGLKNYGGQVVSLLDASLNKKD